MKRSPLVTLRRHEIDVETRRLGVDVSTTIILYVVGMLVLLGIIVSTCG